MNTITTVFAVHNHQPIGNFDTVFEEAFQRSYRPFLEVVGRYPSLKITQHWTGPLLDWLLRRHPDHIELMKDMVQQGQLELLTGAYYEAILAVIPPADRIGQIRKLTHTIETLFGVHPRGLWLAERVWEQPLAASLAEADVEFVVVDDTHFRHAGLRDEQLLGYYMTEEQGRTVKVFPIDKTLRYTVPFRPVAETIEYLRTVASADGRRVVLNADDGEKFGVWPKTYAHVYEDGWLVSFCRALDEEKGWIKTSHLGAIVDDVPPQGLVYLPTASYAEMMKWALHSASFNHLERFEEQLKELGLHEQNAMFVRGGFWRNFFARYPEANHMHKKMLRVASRARSRVPPDPVVLDHVWAGQCNDPYWHGVFGGLYLPNLRFPVYRNLLLAERALDALEDGAPLVVEKTDFDCDGADEVLVESRTLNLYVKPSAGGSLVELDHKPSAFNLLDILSRREEGYHRRLRAGPGEHRNAAAIHDGVLVKEEGLERHLHVDWYRHASFLDHFFGEATTLETFQACRYSELGDFVNQPYSAEISATGNAVSVMLRRSGALWNGTVPHRLTVEKSFRYTAGNDAFSVGYRLANDEDAPVDLWFGVELNVGLMAGDAHDRFIDIEGRVLADRRLRSTGVEHGVKRFRCVDEWLGLETGFRLSEAASLWRCPIETVSLSEGGFERLYQSTMFIPHWRFQLVKEFVVEIVQSVEGRP